MRPRFSPPCYLLPAASCPLPVASSLLSVARCLLPAARCLLPITLLLSSCSLIKHQPTAGFSKVKFRGHLAGEGVGKWEMGIGSGQEAVGSGQQATGSREQAAGSREQATGSREQATGSREQATGSGQQADGAREKGNGVAQKSSSREEEKEIMKKAKVFSIKEVFLKPVSRPPEETTGKAEPRIDFIKILLIALAVILPPLAVALAFGIYEEFWISLFLTILGWIPGIIHAIWNISKYYYPNI